MHNCVTKLGYKFESNSELLKTFENISLTEEKSRIERESKVQKDQKEIGAHAKASTEKKFQR